MTSELVVAGEGGDTVTVTPGALTQIVVGAAESVAGARVRRRRRGLDVTVGDGQARVQLELAARYGLVLPELAREVQDRVAEALGAMCGVDVERIDVTVEELD